MLPQHSMDSGSTECTINSDISENKEIETPPQIHVIPQDTSPIEDSSVHLGFRKCSAAEEKEEYEAAEEKENEEMGVMEERLAEEYKIPSKKQKLTNLLNQFKNRFMR